MNVFLYTSALVKFFHEEKGTETVSNLIIDPDNDVWILELEEDRLNIAIDSFEKQVERFNVEPLGRAVLEEAAFLMKNHGRKHGLKALDALHLGAFSLISEWDWAFVAADDSLCGVAEVLGYAIINPMKGNG